MALSMNKKVEARLRALPGNNVCCDCDERNPQWASVSFGVFMCLECSGRHRALGVHISFVRSVSMDSWTEKQINMMSIGGNDKCIQFLQSYDVPKNMPIAQKYNTAPALLYRDRITAEVNGQPLPTELPVVKATHSSVSHNVNPAEMSEEDKQRWIADQMRQQEEARERMRAKFGSSSGLSSQGNMAGIGSDSSYRPGSASQTSMALPIDVDLAEVSQKTLDFFSSTWSVLSEQVVKSTQQLLQEGQPAAAHEPSSPQTPSADSSTASWDKSTEELNEQLGKTWSLLSTGAATFWKQATDATSEVLSTLTPVEPQPQAAPVSSSAPAAASIRPSKSNSSMSSWDSVSDVELYPQGGLQSMGMSARSPAPAPAPAVPVRAPSSLSSSTKSSHGSGKDDFFASFGV